jgi:hypothetical protein
MSAQRKFHYRRDERATMCGLLLTSGKLRLTWNLGSVTCENCRVALVHPATNTGWIKIPDPAHFKRLSK